MAAGIAAGEFHEGMIVLRHETLFSGRTLRKP